MSVDLARSLTRVLMPMEAGAGYRRTFPDELEAAGAHGGDVSWNLLFFRGVLPCILPESIGHGAGVYAPMKLSRSVHIATRLFHPSLSSHAPLAALLGLLSPVFLFPVNPNAAHLKPLNIQYLLLPLRLPLSRAPCTPPSSPKSIKFQFELPRWSIADRGRGGRSARSQDLDARSGEAMVCVTWRTVVSHGGGGAKLARTRTRRRGREEGA
ncbi:hypothetical protein CVT26_005539 [Gymnopilus dilepis]|uniref:Uncharacterized protein n=1 Tax=Gymnopilus dilepis TaxID=231916 RepID=A0A409WC22_9AGAR|nr:hypothetical protein CVT26_005539 [Gymnopilus dilepis]